MDFWISVDFCISFWISVDGVRDFFRDGPLVQACIQRVCSTSREKRTSKHGISIVLKLVSIEYQRRDAFLAAV